MNTPQRYGRSASDATPVVPTAKKPDQQAFISGGRLATQLTTPFTQQTRMRRLIASLSVTEMDWYGEFVFGSLEEQEGGVNDGN